MSPISSPVPKCEPAAVLYINKNMTKKIYKNSEKKRKKKLKKLQRKRIANLLPLSITIFAIFLTKKSLKNTFLL